MRIIEPEKPKTFQPVTIVIETEDELRALWHRMNVPINDIRSAYKPDASRYGDYQFDVDVDHPIWRVLDNALTARGLKP